MFKTKIIVLTLLISLSILTAFSKKDPIVLKDVEINVIKTAGLLRYDFVLKKTKQLNLDNNGSGDSPGHDMFHHNNGLNFAVRPNPDLASLMELEQNTKYVKMRLRGGGNSGDFREEEVTLSLEYSIKNGSDFEEVRKSALDSTLLVLLGNKVIAEIPLNKKE